ncbi:hypothetical protein BUALT_Bualt02G0178300 [Buddleja alternifolia]|uniref:DNA-directed RNA polymerase n=1 Tax=Buddleja alternifolia TaxID=168488 RepID=A0AAV6Y381_9LAMI|nr:hypothetical protein BUALT_Bualt02G0178300 [Buddleja alternifolia]
MGNTLLTPCFRPDQDPTVKLISHGGATRTLAGKHLAGEIMFQFPDHIICHADSFFIGHPIPSLAIDDELITGQTYFLLPLDCVTQNCVLSASTLAALGSDPNSNRGSRVCFKDSQFEYLKGSDGRVLIKVVPEFITRLISRDDNNNDNNKDIINGDGSSSSFLCSTPELQKHYNQLVGPRDQLWSPKLETISEYKIRFSPCRFIGMEWKQKEIEN